MPLRSKSLEHIETWLHAHKWAFALTIVAMSCFALFIAFLVLYLTKKPNGYVTSLEQTPDNMAAALLDCTGVANTYSEEALIETGSSATTKCIFSGNLQVAQGRTEAQIQQLCNNMPACWAYVKTTTTSSQVCGNAQATCSTTPYNWGRPEYKLIRKSGLQAVTSLTQGSSMETLTVTFIKP